LEWEKGTVDGATEANVDVLEYVLGSATAAYGGTLPVVDLLNRRISWEIAALPPGLPEQSVQVTLRTTSNYTGSRPVTFVTQGIVISPVGVSDKPVTLTYQFVPTVSPSPTAAPSPSPSPSVTGQITSSASAQTVPSLPPVILNPSNWLTSISEPSIGATTTRVRVVTLAPEPLVLTYGIDDQLLVNSVKMDGSAAAVDFFLSGLQPSTKYYFRLSSQDGRLQSDIFSFVTASKAVENLLSSVSITLTQERNLVYYGPVAADLNEPSQPSIVTNDSVLDLTFKVANSKSIKEIEAYIRNTAVLGISTEEFNLDELQSTSTRLTRVADDLFVGKLRMPKDSGRYEVVGRIQDQYGNITERELKVLTVVQPFRVIDAADNEPLEHARVQLFLFNPDTKLYEVISNVTLNMQNPAYSGSNGVVKLVLLPAKYKAVVSLTGYTDQEVEFEISDSSADYPLVLLERNSWLATGAVRTVVGSFKQTSQEVIKGLLSLTHIQDYYRITVYATTVLLGVLILMVVVLTRYPDIGVNMVLKNCSLISCSPVVTSGFFFVSLVFRFCIEILIAHTLFFGIVFLYSTDPRQGLLLLGIFALEVALATYLLLRLRLRELALRK
jgi:hypothetical protein